MNKDLRLPESLKKAGIRDTEPSRRQSKRRHRIQNIRSWVRSRGRISSFECAQLLTESKDLEAEVVAGTEESAGQVRKPMENGIMGPDL